MALRGVQVWCYRQPDKSGTHLGKNRKLKIKGGKNKRGDGRLDEISWRPHVPWHQLSRWSRTFEWGPIRLGRPHTHGPSPIVLSWPSFLIIIIIIISLTVINKARYPNPDLDLELDLPIYHPWNRSRKAMSQRINVKRDVDKNWGINSLAVAIMDDLPAANRPWQKPMGSPNPQPYAQHFH